MAGFRFVHVGIAAALAAAGAASLSIVQGVDASPSPSSSFVSIVPCRLLDTRADSPLGPRHTLAYPVWGTNGACSIPSSATAITANVTIANPTAASYLTIAPAHVPNTGTSSLNWAADSSPVANQVTVGLSPDGRIAVTNDAGAVDVIIDVAGYFEPGSGGAPGPKGDKGDPGDSQLAALNCGAGQTIEWDSGGEQWECGDDADTLAALGCSTGQTVRYDGSAWKCQFDPIQATLSLTSYSFDCCTVADTFDAYSPNIDANRMCDDILCTIELVDVLDHTSCSVTMTGNSQSGSLNVDKYTDRIQLHPMLALAWGQPLYINVSCTT